MNKDVFIRKMQKVEELHALIDNFNSHLGAIAPGGVFEFGVIILDEYIELLVERGGAQYSAANIKTRGLVGDDLAIVFKLEKIGSRYTAYYATGGKDFKLLGSTDVVLSDLRVGLIACEGESGGSGMDILGQMIGRSQEGNAVPFKVKFDYFQIVNAGNQ